MRRLQRDFILFVLLCLLLSACGQAQLLLPTATAQLAVTASYTATRTLTTNPSFTPRPTHTTTPSPTSSITSTVTDASTPQIETDATVGPSSGDGHFPAVLNGLDSGLTWGSSPHKDWFWAFGSGKILDSSGFPEARPLVFRSADGTVEWRVMPTLDDLDGVRYIDVMYYPIFWSPDGSSVSLVLAGYGPEYSAGQVERQWTLDLETGQLQQNNP